MRTRSVVKRRVLTVLLGVSVLALTPALAARRDATASATVVGPEVGSQQPSIAYESPTQMNADLDAMGAAGMTWIRADFYWSAIELQRGHYSWDHTDNFVRAANARGLRILALADYTPTWARAAGTTDKYPPTNPSDYAAFVHAAALRYAPMGVHAWEIWNEPNNAAFWAPRANAVAYTALLKAAYPAIKSADANATVVTGGLSPAADGGGNLSPFTFLDEVYANGGRSSFDAVGYHPYSYPYAPMYAASWNTFYRTPDVHALMARNGDDAKQVWGTEVGFPTGTAAKAVSATTQASYVSAAIDQWTAWSFHGPIFFYTIRDLGSDATDVNDNMGMVDRSGTPKAVFTSVQRTLEAPRDVRATAVTGGATVTWSPPMSDYGRPITEYRVTSAPSGATVTVSGSSRSATFALGTGISEQFSVEALRGYEVGLHSERSNAVTPGMPPPTLAPGVSIVKRPHTATATMRIPVRLSAASTATVTVRYATKSYPPAINARPGIDYVSKSGVLTFAPGRTVAYVFVAARPNNSRVGTHVFLVQFSGPSGATLSGYYGLGIGKINL